MHSLRRVFAAVALALIVAPLLASPPLFDPDEGLHAAIAQEMVRRGDYVTPTFLGAPFLDKPILFFWAEAVSIRLFGDTERAVRLPPLLFGLLGMISVALLGRALCGDAAGLIAGIAYATMTLPLGVSQVAVHDIALIPFMCVACWCLAVSAAAQRPLLLALLAGVMLGLSILTKGLAGGVFVGIFAVCLAVQDRSRIPRLAFILVVAGAVAVVIAAPWYAAMERAHPGYLHYYFVERHLQGYLTATQRHAGRPWWYYLPIVAGGALPWTAYLIAAARSARGDRVRVIAWSWFAAGLLFLSIGESKLVTYALPVFPAIAILIGDAVARLAADMRGRSRAFAGAFAVHATFLAVLPAAGLVVVRRRFGADGSDVWLPIVLVAAVTSVAAYKAWRAHTREGFISWIAGAGVASIAGVMLVLPQAAAWMTARDLAAAVNARATLPPRLSVVGERVGSLLFYLSPDLRAAATPETVTEASFAETLLRVRRDPDDALVAVRNNQLDRFNRLFPRAPAPDARAGTFTVFRTQTLREALQSR
jgi:4-amino-4-deoxy-L-arabinose transferase-like glycosyltransferase